MSLRVLPGIINDDELQQLQTLILLLMGTKAVMYNPQLAAQRARRLIKDVVVEFVPDTGHLLTLERPEAVNEHILRFLNDNKLHLAYA
jgi:pimeloyl-ACP methyl ester carboxylesterase